MVHVLSNIFMLATGSKEAPVEITTILVKCSQP